MSGFDWDDLRVFLAVLRAGSVRGAAQNLRVSQSTVSRRIDGLEGRLGARLFHRMPKGLVATETGEDIQARAEAVEAEMLGIEREVLGRDAALEGNIVISMAPPIARHLMMPVMAEFMDTHPAITIDVRTGYGLSDLSGREADIALRFTEDPDPHLVGRRLPDLSQSVFATPDYLATHLLRGPEATGAWIGHDRGAEAFPTWVRKGPFPDCPVQFRCGDIDGQTAAAKAGMGLAMLPYLIGDQEPDLVRVPGAGDLRSTPFWVLSHPDLRRTARMRACTAFIADRLTKKADLLSGKAA